MKRLAAFALSLVSVISVIACSSSGVDRNAGTEDGGGLGPILPNDGGTSSGEQIGTLSGRVFAPNGRLPMPGALVYVTREKPAALPTQTYCDKCIDTGSGNSSTLSRSDGKFELKVYQAGTFYLVTQKGQFRRVRKIEVKAGNATVADEDTTFPSATSGDDTAPLMAVVGTRTDGYDRIEISLEKLGITQYDFIEPGQAAAFIKSAAKMQKYHVVFLPCGAGDVGGPGACGTDRAADAGTKTALRDFVSSGGKLYVTDFSYEYLNQSWPGYVNWTAQKQGVIPSPLPGVIPDMPGPDWSKDGRGTACTTEPWNGEAKFEDNDLNGWLHQSDVFGAGKIELEGNWTTAASVNEVTGKNENGVDTKITPKIWARGKKGNDFIPTTLSFQDTCGRVLFSSYHTENDESTSASDLTAQEASLLYVLLEVNGCIGDHPNVQ